MTKSLVKAKNGYVAISFNSETQYIDPKELKINGVTLEDVLKQQDEALKKQALVFEHKLIESLKELELKLGKRIDATDLNLNSTQKQLDTLETELQKVGM